MEASLKISRAITNLSFSYPFYGSCLMQLKITETKTIPTLATDGVSILYNSDFIDELAEDETRACLCHEVLHVIFKHCRIMRGKDPKLCNVAMDWVINDILKTDGFKLPKCALFDPSNKTKGWAWEEVYKYLENINNDKEDSFEGIAGKEDASEPSDSQKQKIKDQISEPEEHVVATAPSSAAEEEEASNKIDDMIIKAANAQENSGKGNIPGDICKKITEIREPKLDWEEILQQLIKSHYPDDYTFRRPNRRHLGEDLYMPSMDGTEVGELVIAFDSSGSVSEEETKAFVGEVNTIINDIKPNKVYLMSSDYRVANVEEYDSNVWFSYEEFKSVGGGGTSFKPVFDYVKENDIEPDQLIYFSDMLVGRSDYPDIEPDYPTIFVSTRKDIKTPFGEVVYLDI